MLSEKDCDRPCSRRLFPILNYQNFKTIIFLAWNRQRSSSAAYCANKHYCIMLIEHVLTQFLRHTQGRVQCMSVCMYARSACFHHLRCAILQIALSWEWIHSSVVSYFTFILHNHAATMIFEELIWFKSPTERNKLDSAWSKYLAGKIRVIKLLNYQIELSRSSSNRKASYKKQWF